MFTYLPKYEHILCHEHVFNEDSLTSILSLNNIVRE